MKIIVTDSTRKFRVRPGAVSRFIACSLGRLGYGDEAVLSVQLVSREALRKMNNATFGRDHYTDVIAFPLIDSKERARLLRGRSAGDRQTGEISPALLGELFVSPEQAQKQRARFGNTFDLELKILLAHGLLHIHGLDDDTARSRESMNAAGDELVAACPQELRLVTEPEDTKRFPRFAGPRRGAKRRVMGKARGNTGEKRGTRT
jgi:probable rRNA maturation factor